MSRPYAHRKAQNIRRKTDHDICQCCGSNKNVAAHHIWEYSKGGPSTVEGMVTVCQKCHLRMIHKDSDITIEKKENGITTYGKGGK